MHNRLIHLRDTHAFTLVEMSIVLAIIGLLVGAVIGGSQLLRQSELQTVISDYSKYSSAVAQFRQQFGGLPGDIIDATNYWGDDATAVTGCADANVTNGTPGTCNGNGDGKVRSSADTNNADGTSNTYGATYDEPYRAWQQLVLAKLIDGNYTGLTGGGGAANSVPGSNVPRSRITNSGWSFWYNTDLVGNTDWYAQNLGNVLAFGAATSSGITWGPALTPTDAWQIDKKIDDASPAYGKVLALKKSPSTITPNCTDSVTDASAKYNISYGSAACSLMISLPTK